MLLACRSRALQGRRVPLPRVVTCCRRWHSHGPGHALSLRMRVVSCAPSRQLTANNMSQWRVAGSGSRTVRSFLHTGHEKGTDEDYVVWHQRQLAVVVDHWRDRNGTEPSAEGLEQMSSLLEDLTRMHSAQNGGALPADADVRTWFRIPASEAMASAASSKKCSADANAAAEELKLKPDEKEWHSLRKFCADWWQETRVEIQRHGCQHVRRSNGTNFLTCQS